MHTGNNMKQQKMILKILFSRFLTSIQKMMVTLKELTAKKCMFRINRDVRFSKDKSPYKTNLGASMDKGGKKSGLAGYYFHYRTGRKVFWGRHLGNLIPINFKKVRQEIDYCFDEFKKIISSKNLGRCMVICTRAKASVV